MRKNRFRSAGQISRMDVKIKNMTRLTSFGQLVVLWLSRNEKPALYRILLSGPDQSAELRLRALFPHSIRVTCPEMEAVADEIELFMGGKPVRFSLDQVQMDACSDFQKEVLLAEYGIPRGAVSTYRRIARFLGKPNAARAVGNALANNPFPIIIPCHRAIRSDRSLGGFQGGTDMKRALLQIEGLRFDLSNRVVNPVFFY